MSDLNLKCVDCGNDFIFTEGEQSFFKEKGLFTPKRCPYCRKQKREQKMSIPVPSKTWKDDNIKGFYLNRSDTDKEVYGRTDY